MKTLSKLLVILILTSASVAMTNVAKSQVTASVSFTVFHDQLQPYGRWVHHSRYGEVWIPRVSGFRPYSTGGHWAYTDYGWTWVSDYDWGWAAFHYGRWAYDPSYGWVWVPGYEWGPAWVSWRSDNDYYGWAPLTPGVDISVGVSFGSSLPADYWVFAPARYITSPVIYRYYVPRTKNVTIIKRTTIINNVHQTNFSNQKIVVVGGPKREDVERVAHTKVAVMHVNESSKPGRETVDRSKNTINVYRPVINKTTVNKTVVNNKEVNNKTVNNDNTVNNNNKKDASKPTSSSANNNDKKANQDANDKAANKNQQAEKKPGSSDNKNNTKQQKPEPSKKPAPSKQNDNNKKQNDNKKPNDDSNHNNDKDKKPQAVSHSSKANETARQHQNKNDKRKAEQNDKSNQKNKSDNGKDVAKSNNDKHKPNQD